jgi:hypothetical protein
VSAFDIVASLSDRSLVGDQTTVTVAPFEARIVPVVTPVPWTANVYIPGGTLVVGAATVDDVAAAGTGSGLKPPNG